MNVLGQDNDAAGRVAKSAGNREGASSIAKDLTDSKDPKHTRNSIGRDLRAFSGVIFASFDGSSNIFATAQSLEHRKNISH